MIISQSLSYFTKLCDGQTINNDESVIVGYCSVENPKANHLTFIEKAKHLKTINPDTFYIIKPEWSDEIKKGIIHKHPRTAFRMILSSTYKEKEAFNTISNNSYINENAKIGDNCKISNGCQIGKNTELLEGCFIGNNTVVENDVFIGKNCYIGHNVTLCSNTVIGDGCRISSGAVIGDRGFGFNIEQGKWVAIPQIGKVVIGNQVFIGANSCIDRGAIDDTIIEDNVIIDNLVHIAHNVFVGSGTAMASGVGVAGSTKIGRRCLLAGQVGVVGHIRITDDVHINGGAKILRSIDKPGLYSGSFHVLPAMTWNKLTMYFSKLEKLFKGRGNRE